MARRMIAALGVCFALGACVENSYVVEFSAPQASNPVAGVAVNLVEVTDSRHFVETAPTWSLPSLDAGEFDNPQVSARAVGRRRGASGQPLGGVLLPQWRTVAQLVQDALSTALKKKGYRVLRPIDSGYAEAPRLAADIKEFWTWSAYGGPYALGLAHRYRIQLLGPWPITNSETELKSQVKRADPLGSDELWQTTVEAGLADLVANLGQRLKAPPTEAR